MEALNSRNVFLATMTHNDLLHHKMARQFFLRSTMHHNCIFNVQPGSLLAANYNKLWCTALNMAVANKLKWFAMLHADIAPQDFWLDTLIDEAEGVDANVMSAVIPIKDHSGVTSTAISDGIVDSGVYDSFLRTRLTMAQVHDPHMPSTFDIKVLREAMPKIDNPIKINPGASLLVNTGCMVCRIDREWCRHVKFTIRDRIVQVGDQFVNQVEPEDWYFSRKVAEVAGDVWATTAVKAMHYGNIAYDSGKVWGNSTDPART